MPETDGGVIVEDATETDNTDDGNVDVAISPSGDFGGFNGANDDNNSSKPAAAPLAENIPAEPDDPFGHLDSQIQEPVTCSSPENNKGAEPQLPSAEKSLAEPDRPKATTNEVSESNIPILKDDDAAKKDDDTHDFFGGVLGSESNQSVAQPLAGNSTPQDDLFGGFEPTNQPITAQIPPETASQDDIFGGFEESTPSTTVDKNDTLVSSNADLMDPFDAFNSIAPVASSDTQPPALSGSNAASGSFDAFDTITNDNNNYYNNNSEMQMVDTITPVASYDSQLPASANNNNTASGSFDAFDTIPSDNYSNENPLDQPQQPPEPSPGADVFGGFESNDQMAGNDSFGGFETATASETKDIDTTKSDEKVLNVEDIHAEGSKDTNLLDDFGSFETTPVEKSNGEGLKEQEGPNFPTPVEENSGVADSDEFNDFAGVPPPPTSMEEENAAPFPDNKAEQKIEPAAKEESNENAEDDDFGFGDFDSAPAKADASEPKEEAVVQESDDFGDFGHASTEGEADNKELAAQQTPSSDAFDDDDFGDFDEAPLEEQTDPPEQPAPTATSNHEFDDDDFGDFGEAPVEEQKDATKQEVQDQPVADDFGDDDFGDFGEAPAPEPKAQETDIGGDAFDDDDDFGDFDEAPPQQAAITEQQVQSAEGGDEFDDDDFGDFGEAPAEGAPSTQPSADGFGDFSSFPDKSAPVPQPSLANDPVAQHTRAVFPNLFAKYAVSVENEENEIAEPKKEALLVKNILASIGDVHEASKMGKSYKSVIDLLKDTTISKKSSSCLIVGSDKDGPFSYTSYPIGGLKSLAVTLLDDKDVGRDSAVYLPEVLPIKLPEAEESKPTATQKKAEEKSTTRPPAPVLRETIVSLPPPKKPASSEAASTKNGSSNDAPTERAKNFLQRIPDLSYMLSSKLSVPSGK